MLLTDCIKVIARQQPFKHLYIAYSGGVDSHVLLHLCAQQPHWREKIIAVYVHHGLQTPADAWARHCELVAQTLGVGYQCIRVNAQAQTGESPEEAARNARYQALAALLEHDDLLLLAQHQDDQLETLLLQMFRGAGLAGLAAMPELAPLGLGRMLRPLLAISQSAIKQYAEQQQLQWVEDPSNHSDAYDRNYLRRQVIPLLQQRWPAVASTVSRSARHCADAQALQQSLLLAHLPEVLGPDGLTLALTKLAQFPLYQQQGLVRCWLGQRGLKMPASAQLQAIFTQVIHASPSRDPVLCLQQHQIRRYRQHLYCLPEFNPTLLAVPTQIWPQQQATLILNNYAQLSISQADEGIDAELWQSATVSVAARQGGEKIALPGRIGRHSLKNLFQEASVPPWLRAYIPLIFLDGQLAAVADLWVSREVWVQKKAGAVKIRWQSGI